MSTLTSKGNGSTAPGAVKLAKILVVDDDESVRGLIRMRLSDTYQVVDTGDPEQALALALENKPDAILLDLMMPGLSGFELCQSFHSLSYTSRIPIFVITGEAGTRYKEHVETLGAKGYFHKPVDFAALKAALAAELDTKQPERRKHKRVQMRVTLKLRGTDASGKAFEESIATENVSAYGFLSNCAATLVKGSAVEVFLAAGGQERYAGHAQVVRQESTAASWHRYGFQFLETTSDWLLQDK
ncbi:MAG: response regulator [Candidatus Acidiferrales bacterium]